MVKVFLKIFSFVLVVFTLLLFLSFLGVTTFNHSQAFVRVNNFLQQYANYFAVWRYFLMVAIVIFYPRIIYLLYRSSRDVDVKKLNEYSKRRYIVIALLLVEVLIVHNGLAWGFNRLISLF